MASRTPLGTLVNGYVVPATDLNKLPRGEVGYVLKTADQGAITVTVDVTSLTLTLTLDAARRYRWTVKGELTHATADGVAVVQLADAANAQLDRWVVPGNTVQVQSHSWSYEENGGGASVTRKVRAVKLSGTGAVTYGGAASIPSRLSCEDIGPAFT